MSIRVSLPFATFVIATFVIVAFVIVASDDELRDRDISNLRSIGIPTIETGNAHIF